MGSNHVLLFNTAIDLEISLMWMINNIHFVRESSYISSYRNWTNPMWSLRHFCGMTNVQYIIMVSFSNHNSYLDSECSFFSLKAISRIVVILLEFRILKIISNKLTVIKIRTLSKWYCVHCLIVALTILYTHYHMMPNSRTDYIVHHYHIMPNSSTDYTVHQLPHDA